MLKRIFFFATPGDIVPLLARFEANAPLKFAELGNFATPERAIYLSPSELPDPGIATNETGAASRSYLVLHRGAKLHECEFLGKRGEKRWSLDNGGNDKSTVLTMGGLWRTGTLLPGLMDTLHATPAAQQLMLWFRSALRQEDFTRVQSWWLGREALALLRAGRRLTTTAEQSPPEFDLKLPDELKAQQ